MRSTPQRRVSLRYALPVPGTGRGSSMAVTISPRAHAVTRGETKKEEIGTERSPLADAIRTAASCTNRGGAESLAGDALQMLPTTVARFRIATEPTLSVSYTH